MTAVRSTFDRTHLASTLKPFYDYIDAEPNLLQESDALTTDHTAPTALPIDVYQLQLTSDGTGNAAQAVAIPDPATNGIIGQRHLIQAKSIVVPTTTTATGTLTGDGTNITAADYLDVDTHRYTFVAALTEAKGVGTLTVVSGNIADLDTVTVGGKVYTFRAILGTLDGSVALGASDTASLLSLSKALAKTGTGADYDATNMAANAQVDLLSVGATTMVVRAKAVGTSGNTASTSTGGHATWATGTLLGGINSIANEVVKGGTAAVSLTRLYEALNAGANKGVDYSTATNDHPTVSATNPTPTTVVILADTAGRAGNSLATTEASTHLSFGHATLTGAVDAETIAVTHTYITAAGSITGLALAADGDWVLIEHQGTTWYVIASSAGVLT